QPCYAISADPSMKTFEEESSCREIAEYFSQIAEADYDRVLPRLLNKTRSDGKASKYAFIARDVDVETADIIKKHIAEKKWKGIAFVEETKRFYPCNELLANIVGFVNISEGRQIPQGGIEKIKQNSIGSEDGKTVIERDRKGTPFEERVIQRSRDGVDVYLTVSQKIQMIVEEELDKLVQQYSPKSAYVVMVNPRNGNIMAVAQRPTFNPNDRKTMNDPEACRDKVITDVFEPGSIMKAISVSGALDFGVVRPETKFNCENGLGFFAGRSLRDAHPCGIMPVSEIIQKSSNIGTAKISEQMGEKRLYNILCRFGFGQKTGIPIQPEATGIFRPLQKWDKLSLSRFAIGQGIAVTPLQMVRAYCAIANGGKLVKIRLIDREVNPETGEVLKISEEPAPQIFTRKDTSREMIEMLKLVTKKGGTAERAAVKGYDVAGKTGTSQKAVNGVYSNSQYHSSFIGFVPADDPAFVMIVTVDEPKENHYGGVVAAPTFRFISEKVLQILNVPPQYPEEYESASAKKNSE
nr:penicillin-binding protein 2 [Victivallales bacterium]